MASCVHTIGGLPGCGMKAAAGTMMPAGVRRGLGRGRAGDGAEREGHSTAAGSGGHGLRLSDRFTSLGGSDTGSILVVVGRG